MAQKPDATQVAGYRKWQELRRQVKKGEQAIKIFVPFKKKLEDPDTGEEKVRLIGFGVGNVFDVSQTDGEPLPKSPTAAAIAALQTSDAKTAEVNRRLSWWLKEDEGLTLTSEFMHGNKRGYYAPQHTPHLAQNRHPLH